MGSRRKKMTFLQLDSVTVLHPGTMEIWDGADLSLLRDSLLDVITNRDCRSVGVDLSYVKYIPSGFFGMLFDWHEQGVQIHVYCPQPNVARMLWFRQFFTRDGEGSFLLNSQPNPDVVVIPMEEDWDDEEAAAWDNPPQKAMEVNG